MNKMTKIQDIYSLNPMQEGMLFHYIYENESPVFLEQYTVTLEGKFDTTVFEMAFNILIDRHDALRTIFVYKSTKKPRQVVLKEQKTTVQYDDISLIPQAEITDYIEKIRARERATGFNLSSDIAMRFVVLKTGKTHYRIIWTFHHIIIDGWCTSILLKELFTIYSRLLESGSILLPPPPRYSTYIHWLEKQDKQASLDYWKDTLSGYKGYSGIPQTKVSYDKSYKQGIFEFEIDRIRNEKVKSLCEHNKFTLNAFIRTLWGVLLQKYNNQNEACFGVVVSGRPVDLPNVDKIVGLFMNTIPARIICEDNESFINCVRKTNQSVVESKKHEYLPLIDILKLTEQKQRLIDHVIVFENYPIDSSLFSETNTLRNGFSIKNVIPSSQANYDLDVTFFPQNTIKVTIHFNRNIYSEAIIKNIKPHFIHLMDQIITDNAVTIKKLHVITNDEIRYYLEEFNNVKRYYPVDKPYPELFEEAAAKYPDNTAIIFGDVKISYHHLHENVNRTAQYMINKGFMKNDIIGLLFHRSPAMIEIILAAWKLGCSYIPLDPAYPRERIKHIISDSQLKAIITSKDMSGTFGEQELIRDRIFLLQDIENFPYDSNDTNRKIGSSPDSLAYIIYTSGSTGQPKGVMVEQQGMINHLFAKIDAAAIDCKTVMAQNSPHYFDISLWQFFSALLKGGTVAIYPDELVYKPDHFIRALIRDEVSILEVVPSYLRMLLNELNGSHNFTKLKVLFVTGETLPKELTEKWFAKYPDINMINAYGPTEASDDILHHVLCSPPEEDQIPVGTPLPNLNIYIVDKDMCLCPLGVKGEIWVSGIGVGRGYLNNPEKTTAVFLDNPFINDPYRCYRTGDIGRLSPEGYVEFFGRMDHQVKIRGFRIELEEIEHVLLQNPGITEAVVNVCEGERGDNYLCAYYVSDKGITPRMLRGFLATKLSDYMIPAFFVKMENLPVTSNGKIDRSALPEPELVEETENFEAAGTENEKILVKVWQDVLGIKKEISIHENYFFLGGDSIKGIMIVSHLAMHQLKLDIQDLFEFPTIHALSRCLKPLHIIEEQGPVTGTSRLSAIQHWFYENNYTDSHHINQAVMVAGKNRFDEISLKKAFEKVIEHHDALRNVFVRKGHNYIQKTREVDENLLEMTVFDFNRIDDYQHLIEEKSNLIQASIDLEHGPFLKLGLFKTKDRDFLLIVVHHLIIDGVSWRIIFEDFTMAYQQIQNNKHVKLPLKTTSLQKWGRKIYEYSNSDKLLGEIPYWEKVAGMTIQSLPKDHKTLVNIVKNSEIGDFQLSLDKTSQLLKDIHLAYNTEINDILLASLGLALSHWSGHKKHAIDLEGHGRESIISDIDISRTVGWFTALYPVVLDFPEGMDLSLVIKRTKEILREVPHKGIGYGILRYITHKEYTHNIGFNLKPEIKFNYLGQFDEDINTPLFQRSNMPTGHPVSPNSEREYCLDIVGIVLDGKLRISIVYNNSEYEKKTILSLMNFYRKSLLEIIDHCINKNETELTKSDFSSSRLNEEDVTNMYDALENIFDSE